jgi:hypothetical protein
MKDFTMNMDCLDPAPVTAGNFVFCTMSRPALANQISAAIGHKHIKKLVKQRKNYKLYSEIL